MNLTIRLKSMHDILSFVKINEQSECDIDIKSGRYLVNGKSLMSVFGIDIINNDVTICLAGTPSACEKTFKAYQAAGFEIKEA